MIFLSCRIQINLAHQILALAFKMFMAASAALCFASFLLVPSPEVRLKKKTLYAVKNVRLAYMFSQYRIVTTVSIHTLGNKNIYYIVIH